MEKTYILLRSSKQQGPFNLAQLAKMELKPEDLVNVQGGIAGWQYAREIDVLKPYLSGDLAPSVPVVSVPSVPVSNASHVPVADAPFVPIADTPPVSIVPKEKNQEASPEDMIRPAEQDIPKVEQRVPKPAGVFASFPAGTELSPSGLELKRAVSLSPENPQPSTGIEPVETSPPVPEVPQSIPVANTTKPSVIKPAPTAPPRVAMNETTPPLTATKPVVIKPVAPAPPRAVAGSVPRSQQTRATATLRTSLPVSRRRRKVKPAVLISSLLALGILAFAVGQFATGSDRNVSSRRVGRSNTNLATNTTGSTTELPDNRTALQQELPLAGTDEQKNTPIPANETSPAQPFPKGANMGAQRQTIASKPDSQQEVSSNMGKADITDPAKPAAKEPAKGSADLTEQIYLKSNFINNELGEGIFDLNVSIDNKSDKVLKTVAVNIFYTDDDGKALNKQTVYFSNVKPGETMARPASPHKLATRVRCELGLVSSEGLLYYAN